nr:photosystem I subunit IX [Cephalanthera nanchuanica]WQH82919.1 photosystem I subunit IX [Cephalanthera nanchuanica]
MILNYKIGLSMIYVLEYRTRTIYVLQYTIQIKNYNKQEKKKENIKYKEEGGFSMRDIKTYLSTAPVLTTLWFGSLAGLLIEINRLFPDALSFPFFSF